MIFVIIVFRLCFRHFLVVFELEQRRLRPTVEKAHSQSQPHILEVEQRTYSQVLVQFDVDKSSRVV